MALGGWKTRHIFERYSVTDEADLAATSAAYDAFLDAQTATVVARRRA